MKPPSTRPVMSLFDDDDLDQEPTDFFGTKQTITTTAAPTQVDLGLHFGHWNVRMSVL